MRKAAGDTLRRFDAVDSFAADFNCCYVEGFLVAAMIFVVTRVVAPVVVAATVRIAGGLWVRSAMGIARVLCVR